MSAIEMFCFVLKYSTASQQYLPKVVDHNTALDNSGHISMTLNAEGMNLSGNHTFYKQWQTSLFTSSGKWQRHEEINQRH